MRFFVFCFFGNIFFCAKFLVLIGPSFTETLSLQSFRDGTSSSLSSSFRSGRDTHIFRAKFLVSLKFLMWIFFSGFDVVVVDSVDVVVVVVVDGVVV